MTTLLEEPIESVELVDDATIIDKFHYNCKQHPTRIALQTPACTLTYAECDQLSDAFAEFIQQAYWDQFGQPMPTHTVIALCLNRTFHALIAVLGIWKCGGIYMALLGNEGPSRIHRVLALAKPALLITEPDAEFAALNLGATKWLPLPASFPQVVAFQYRPLAPMSVAYYCFTSGTTGQPKAIQVSHQMLQYRSLQFVNTLGLTAKDKLIGLSLFNYDNFLLELSAALLMGGTLCLAEDASLDHPKQLAAWIAHCKADAMLATPSRWMQLVGWQHLFQVPLLCIACGERLTSDLVAKLQPYARAVWNFYGASETILTCLCQVTAAQDPVPIGPPQLDAEITLLNATGQPAAPGEAGQCVVSGPGVALGYLGDPDNPTFEITAAGERRYHSGDWCYFVPGKGLYYSGRHDSQVKILGHRVELGAIEQALLASPVVAQCRVAQLALQGQSILVAQLAVWPEATLPENTEQPQLHDYFAPWLARASLPPHCTPQVYCQVSAELSHTGKRHWPSLQVADLLPLLDQSRIAPTSLHTQLQACWQQVLGQSAIDEAADFFCVGGTSVAAIQLVALLNATFNCEVTPTWLYQHPTFAQQYQALSCRHTLPFQALVALNQVKSNYPPLILFHPGNVGCEVYLTLAAKLAPDLSCFGVDSHSIYSKDPIIQDLDQMIEYYLQAICPSLAQGGCCLGGWSSGGVLALAAADKLTQLGVTVYGVFYLDTLFSSKTALKLNRWLLNSAWWLKQYYNAPLKQAYQRMPKALQQRVLRSNQADLALELGLTPKGHTPFANILLKCTEESYCSKNHHAAGFNHLDKYVANPQVYPVVGEHMSLLQRPDSVARIATHIHDFYALSVPAN